MQGSTEKQQASTITKTSQQLNQITIFNKMTYTETKLQGKKAYLISYDGITFVKHFDPHKVEIAPQDTKLNGEEKVMNPRMATMIEGEIKKVLQGSNKPTPKVFDKK